MTLGPFYHQNAEKIQSLTDNDWRVAIKKCETHIRWKLKQKTLYGAHTPQRLGMDPVEFYTQTAQEKIINGDWEWKSNFTIAQQMIRIADSHISTEVEKSKTKKEESFKLTFTDEIEFYQITDDFNEKLEQEFQIRIDAVERAIEGEDVLKQLWEGIQAGYKRSDIAELMSLTPKQLDKLKERLIERVRKVSKEQK